MNEEAIIRNQKEIINNMNEACNELLQKLLEEQEEGLAISDIKILQNKITKEIKKLENSVKKTGILAEGKKRKKSRKTKRKKSKKSKRRHTKKRR